MSEPQEGDTRLDEKMYVYSLVYCTGKTPCAVSDEQKPGGFHGHWRGGKAVTLADVLAPYRERAERAEAREKEFELDLQDALECLAEARRKRDDALKRLARPAHQHLDGMHYTTPVSGCVCCNAMAERDTLRDTLREVNSVLVTACGGRIFNGGTRPSNATPLENAHALIADAARLREALARYGQHTRECNRVNAYDVRCVCGFDAARTSAPTGTSACPVCGISEPHSVESLKAQMRSLECEEETYLENHDGGMLRAVEGDLMRIERAVEAHAALASTPKEVK
jgi:hypothetical protein